MFSHKMVRIVYNYCTNCIFKAQREGSLCTFISIIVNQVKPELGCYETTPSTHIPANNSPDCQC
eukprot:c25227_g2_i1 orf=126-317(+)